VLDFFAELGPGLITGAADDDPSGIATYSVTGAAFGYGLLWTALFSFPMMAAVQLMCSRLGMITGRGLAAVVRHRYSRWVLWGACFLLTVANVINIGADLGGMADAMHMMTGISALWWTPAFAGFLVAMLLWTSYRVIARTFKWLTAVFVRLCDYGLPGETRLDTGPASNLCAGNAMVVRIPLSDCWCLGHQHFTVPVLLAILSGGGGGESRRKEDAGSTPGRNG
jgi:hypothetical protein